MKRRILILAYRLDVNGQLYKAGATVRVGEEKAEELVSEGKAQFCDAGEADLREREREALAARQGGRAWYQSKE